MKEKIWRITTTKDTMLHILNSIFDQEVKQSTTKENMLKLLPELYKGENLKELIKVISYEAYQGLEKTLKYVEDGLSVEEAVKKSGYIGNDLEEAMIIILRMSGIECEHALTVNPKQLAPMFSNENKKLAQKYDKIEKLIKGLMYSYGVIEIATLRKMICKYMSEIMPEEEIYKFIFKRLDLNLLIDYHYIHWDNTGEEECYISYLDQEKVDIAGIAAEQKGRGLIYKKLKENQVLERDLCYWDDVTEEFYKYLKNKNKSIDKKEFAIYAKVNEIGIDVVDPIMNMVDLSSKNEVYEFKEQFLKWFKNSPQYGLGGYTPNEMLKLEGETWE